MASIMIWESPQHVLVTVVMVCLVVWSVKLFIKRPRNLPPGPPGIPIIGNALTLFRNRKGPLHLFSSWAKEYGDVVLFRVGPTRVILLNSPKVMKDAFQNPLLNYRMPSRLRYEATGLYNHGVILSMGDTWRDQRQFVHSVFRSLGVGKRNYEEVIAAELVRLFGAVNDFKGHPFDPNDLFYNAVSNIICTVVFATQYEYSDPEFLKILQCLEELFELVGTGAVMVNLPIPMISKIPFGKFPGITKGYQRLHGFIADKIEEHERTFDPDSTRDVIDLYLKKKADMADKDDDDTSFTLTNLNATIFDLFIAGTETTSNSLKWAVMYMMTYPEVQSRVQDELDQVIGRNRLPSLADRANLPYTNAVILECWRMACIIPLSVIHVAAADTTLNGYTIPKGSMLYGNIWHAHKDERIWDKPDAFKPERFLSPDGTLTNTDEMVAFSAGRRVCLGEQLARMEMFLFFTSLLHRLTFKKPDSSPPLSFEGVLGVTHNTGPFQTCAIKREF